MTQMDARHHLDGRLLFTLAAAAIAGVLFWNTWPLYPLKLLVVLMHESGHAAATLMVGGSVDAIRISPDMIRKGLTLIGSWHYNLNDFPSVMKVIQESPLIDLLISHVLPMSQIQPAFELSASHETAKIVLRPWE